jgi:hypothetical protein
MKDEKVLSYQVLRNDGIHQHQLQAPIRFDDGLFRENLSWSNLARPKKVHQGELFTPISIQRYSWPSLSSLGDFLFLK